MTKLHIINFSALILLFYFSSCQADLDQEVIAEAVDLEFELVKTLEYDYLGRAFTIDYSKEFGIVALYDDQRDEIIIANEEAILVQKKLSGDNKDSYGSRFAGGLFWKDKLIIFGLGTSYFVYDLDLNLAERVDLPYRGANSIIGPFTFNKIINDWLVYYADTKEDRATMDPPADPVVIWNLDKKELHSTIKTPKGIPQVWNPNGLGMASAQFAYSNNDFFLIYPYHPVIYQVDLQNARFKDSILLEIPKWKMPEVKKHDFENRIEAVFDDLTYPSFTFLTANEDIIITSFQNGIPREEVDQLPRTMLGGEKWYGLENEYRKPIMMAVSGNKIVAENETTRGIDKWAGGMKITTRPLGTEYRDVEEDFIRFYFYKPVLKPKANINSENTE